MIPIVSLVTGGEHEAMVQGKQLSMVRELLSSFGPPKRWNNLKVSGIADEK